MTPLEWLVVLGLVAFPVLFGYASVEYRRGNRTRRSYLRGLGVGAPGFAILLQQASIRWLASPVDDVVAVLSLLFLAVGTYALYLGYVREGTPDEQ